MFTSLALHRKGFGGCAILGRSMVRNMSSIPRTPEWVWRPFVNVFTKFGASALVPEWLEGVCGARDGGSGVGELHHYAGQLNPDVRTGDRTQ